MGLQHRPARHFLRALVSLGLVDKKGDTFTNPPAVEELLVSGKPGYIGGEVIQHERLEYLSMSKLADSLKANSNLGLPLVLDGDGDTLYARMHRTSDKELQETFYKGIGDFAPHGRQPDQGPVRLQSVNNILDLCGGDGTNAIAIAKAYPHLKITVLDLGSVCEIAARNIAAAGLSTGSRRTRVTFSRSRFRAAMTVSFSFTAHRFCRSKHTARSSKSASWPSIPRVGCSSTT